MLSRSSPHSPASRSALAGDNGVLVHLVHPPDLLRRQVVPRLKVQDGRAVRVGRSSKTPGFHAVRSIAPDVPAQSVSKNASRSLPAVDTTPAPVITTRWSSGSSRTEEAARADAGAASGRGACRHAEPVGARGGAARLARREPRGGHRDRGGGLDSDHRATGALCAPLGESWRARSDAPADVHVPTGRKWKASVCLYSGSSDPEAARARAPFSLPTLSGARLRSSIGVK